MEILNQLRESNSIAQTLAELDAAADERVTLEFHDYMFLDLDMEFEDRIEAMNYADSGMYREAEQLVERKSGKAY